VQTAPSTTGFISPGAAGSILSSNGPAAIPTFQAFSSLPIIDLNVSNNITAGNTISAPIINGTTITASGAVNGNSLAVTTSVSAATGSFSGSLTAAGPLTISLLPPSQAVQTNAVSQLVTIPNTGTGSNVLAESPQLITPDIGLATGNSLSLTTPLQPTSGGTGSTSLNTITVGTANNISGGTVGQIPRQDGVGTTTFISGGAPYDFLTLNASSIPIWRSSPTPSIRILTSGSTYTTAATVLYIVVEIVGGGGAGGNGRTGGTAPNAGSGGGAGGYVKRIFPPGTYSYTIGSGGSAAGAGNGGNGSPGTTTTFASMTANGGGGGQGAGATQPITPGIGGSASGGGAAGFSLRGDPGGACGLNNGGNGASSYFGGGGRGVYSSGIASGLPGTDFGAGGGGGCSHQAGGTGGDGAPGAVIITEYIW
jgi:hypothetical protein